MSGGALLAYTITVGALCVVGWIFGVYETIKIHKDHHA